MIVKSPRVATIESVEEDDLNSRISSELNDRVDNVESSPPRDAKPQADTKPPAAENSGPKEVAAAVEEKKGDEGEPVKKEEPKEKKSEE